MMGKILVTGAGGFIGSHLVELLVAAGLDVKAFIHYNARNNWGWLESLEIKNQIEVVSGDIRDYDSVYSALHDCESVFHLAALIGIPYSYVSPRAYIDTNINGTYNILQAAKERSLNQIVLTSTSETYGTAQYVPIDEKHPIVGQSPYSASKISADQLAISYFRSFNLPIKIVRPFNTYGPRQSARAIIPSVISQILTSSHIVKIGSLTPTRDLTFVKDTCSAFYEVFKSDKLIGEVINIGMGTEISISDLVRMILNIFNQQLEIVSTEERIRPANSEVERLVCNNEKLLAFTNWKANYDLRRGLQETINWMEANTNFYKGTLYNI